MKTVSVLALVIACFSLVLLAPSSASARPDAPTSADIAARRDTAAKLRKLITIELNDARLEDVVQFIEDFAAIELEPMWIDDAEGGLDKEQRITVEVKDVPVITLIERVLQKTQTDFSPATWQFAPSGGAVEIGPRSRLNQQAYLRIYDIQDLLFQIPDFEDFPELDLDQVLNQGGQGGGGGGSVFSEEGENEPRGPNAQELLERLTDIITETIEPEQWRENGGDGGSITPYKGALLIRAPDYMHRQLEGYPFDLGRPGVRTTPSRSSPNSPAAPAAPAKP